MITGIFNACEKMSGDNSLCGKLEISLDIPSDKETLKSVIADTITEDNSSSGPVIVSTHHIMISVKNENGLTVLDDELIPLLNFGGNFISRKIELAAGKYTLTRFMVIGPEGRVLFAAPIEGSPKSYLVKQSLPIPFEIFPGKNTRLIPEVLPVTDESPEEFGYASFGFQIIKPLIFYVSAIVDYDNPKIMAPILPVEAKLTVYAPESNWQHSFKLEADVNKIEIRGGSNYYILTGEKEGFPPIKIRASASELLASSKEHPFILRFVKNPIHVVKIKPDSKEGKDAMISNLDPDKNFGDHPYFEATFISEPVLTVMRSNRSLIWFNLNAIPKSAQITKVVLTLYYAKLIPWEYQGAESPISSIKPWYGAVLQQIVEPWDEHKVTWNNQPKTIEENQVYITPFVSTAKYIDIDVSRLYIPMNTMDKANYGMLLKLYPSEQFPGFKFASSDYPEANMHPELTIYFTLP